MISFILTYFIIGLCLLGLLKLASGEPGKEDVYLLVLVWPWTMWNILSQMYKDRKK